MKYLSVFDIVVLMAAGIVAIAAIISIFIDLNFDPGVAP